MADQSLPILRIGQTAPELRQHAEAGQAAGQVQGVLVAAQTIPADQALNLMTLVRGHGAFAAFDFARGLVGADPARARIVERLAKTAVGIIAVVVAVDGNASQPA